VGRLAGAAPDGRTEPTIKGIAIIDPKEPEPPPPLMAIEEVLVDGKPVNSDKLLKSNRGIMNWRFTIQL
jgi:hypothetical protein